jgi:phage terminase Nu1 subunit (DNA packaging protein)
MEVATKRGELVEVSKVEEEWRSLLGAVRSGMLSVPSRVAAQLVTLTDEREIEDAIAAAIHEAMESIAHADPV